MPLWLRGTAELLCKRERRRTSTATPPTNSVSGIDLRDFRGRSERSDVRFRASAPRPLTAAMRPAFAL
jgi:hypothetical protein